MTGILAESHRRSILDPRTKLLLLFTVTLVVVGGRSGPMMTGVKIVLTSVPLFLMLAERKWRMAFIYAFLFVLAFWSSRTLIPVMHGFWGFLVLAFSGIITMLMPGFALGAYLVSSTTVSEFLKAMERLRISDKITIPLSVMFRFFPTVKEECSAIGDAMKMRGVSMGGGKPLDMLEYRMVPLLMSSVKIGDELSAAALTRGLGKPVRRTNIAEIGFRWTDAVCFIISFLSLAAFITDTVGRLM